MKRFLTVLMMLALLLPCFAVPASAEGAKEIKLLFTHDIHDFFTVARDQNGEFGGAARLKTLLDENRDENTLYLDGGDFSMGTLLQAGFDQGSELRILGALGCDVTTFGNHEFDRSGSGAALMLRGAKASGEALPLLVQSNMDNGGTLSADHQALKDALEEYGAQKYVILEKGGVRFAVFGVMGLNAIVDSPTAGVAWKDYIEAAKETVREIGDQADIIICLSHGGTNDDGRTGEDFDLAKAVPEIDIILSAHSHTVYDEAPVAESGAVLLSSGDNLHSLGEAVFEVDGGKAALKSYRLIPCNESVAEDAGMLETIDGIKREVEKDYLADYGLSFDQKITYCGFDFMPLTEMYATHQEYPMGDLIADSYLYAAQKNGIDDIDVALVGLGTIRGSFAEGDVTVADAFNMCSLGVGADGSSGHPLLTAYITGKELKLLVELDASLGPMVSSIKMSYAGLEYSFNPKRMLLDRVTELHLVRPDGTHEAIENDRLYSVCCNMYAANMLGMLNDLTKGILSIRPKFADGTPVENFYDCALKETNGRELKEWYAFADYLMSFEDGIPDTYREPLGRKVVAPEGGAAALRHPGLATWIAIAVIVLLILVIVLIVRGIVKKNRKKKA